MQSAEDRFGTDRIRLSPAMAWIGTGNQAVEVDVVCREGFVEARVGVFEETGRPLEVSPVRSFRVSRNVDTYDGPKLRHGAVCASNPISLRE